MTSLKPLHRLGRCRPERELACSIRWWRTSSRPQCDSQVESGQSSCQLPSRGINIRGTRTHLPAMPTPRKTLWTDEVRANIHPPYAPTSTTTRHSSAACSMRSRTIVFVRECEAARVEEPRASVVLSRGRPRCGAAYAAFALNLRMRPCPS